MARPSTVANRAWRIIGGDAPGNRPPRRGDRAAGVAGQIGIEQRVASTDSRGHYELRYLPVGTYQFTGELSGFEPLAHNVTVIGRSIVDVDLALKLREQRFVDPVWTFIEPTPAVTTGGIEMRFSCGPGALGLQPGAYSLSTASGSTRAARREGK